MVFGELDVFGGVLVCFFEFLRFCGGVFGVEAGGWKSWIGSWKGGGMGAKILRRRGAYFFVFLQFVY